LVARGKHKLIDGALGNSSPGARLHTRKASMKAIAFHVAAAVAVLALLQICPSSLSADKDKDGWVSLFNGKDLDGWVARAGKAKYRVEDNQIIGNSVPNTGNSFLCTTRDYADFILELEFKVDPALNSGVQIRSQFTDKPRPNGKVFGYQVEIDPSPRAWTGGIYDEGRRGWLHDLKKNEPARKAFKQNDWNKFHIECRGDSIKTRLNDLPAADLKDSMTPSGFIGLQVHAVGARKDALEVRFRNLRIKELK
jgi:hypothetical protein